MATRKTQTTKNALHKASAPWTKGKAPFEIVPVGHDEITTAVRIEPGFCATPDSAFEAQVRATLLRMAADLVLAEPDAPWDVRIETRAEYDTCVDLEFRGGASCSDTLRRHAYDLIGRVVGTLEAHPGFPAARIVRKELARGN